MTEREEAEETAIGQSEASNEKSAVGECPVTADQSERGGSEVTSNTLNSISHNSQRVAHKCPQCGKCFIYRSQKNLGVIAGVTFSIAFSQLIGTSLACCLSRLISSNQYEMV
ncbi:tetraspanin-7-like isoform X2 [Pseudoliparis swirei]|uniref:tetraspanin-7-like isoform X2 n=1 Tax=Pseudoliparis swirei TaxID=2059687 RepID=UPI0024BEDBE5|nr:tetraspanin-7-like isoform X2 [Pseudoliparis swirei]